MDLIRIEKLTRNGQHDKGHSSRSGLSFGFLMAVAGTVLLLSSFAWHSVDATQVTPGNDVRTHVNVRSEPSQNGKKIAELLPGQKADMLGESGDWYEVKLSDGATGFVMKAFVLLVEGPRAQPKPAEQRQETTDIQAQHPVAMPAESQPPGLNETRQEVDSLTAFLKKYIRDVDSLRLSTARLETENRRRSASGSVSVWPIVAALAVGVGAAAFFSRYWISRLKSELLNDIEKQRESHASRRSFFAASLPRIEGTDCSACTFFVNLMNCGDNSVGSLQASIFTIDAALDQANIDKELSFSTANPVPGQQDITFREDDVGFPEEYGPKFICVGIEYLDSVINERLQQNFTFRWEGVRAGVVRERIDHVNRETNDRVWGKVRELRWVRGGKSEV